MLNGKTIAVVVPAYNEESQIELVINSMPDFVDRIVIVNDCSKDKTKEVVANLIPRFGSEITIKPYQSKPKKNLYNEADLVLYESYENDDKLYTEAEVVNKTPETDRLILIQHLKNGGVGAAIARGYKWCRDHEIDCTAVMAGDGQMDPDELEGICRPVIEEEIDYVKANRLRHPTAKHVIPNVRFFGNSVLSILTKIASGYWRISDTQTGYTAISLSALRAIKIHDIYKSYGMPNDVLVKLNINQCTLREVTVKPIYRVGEQSKMKIKKVIPKVSYLLLRLFLKRLWVKYLIREFHPLFLLYHFAFLMGALLIPVLIRIGHDLINGISLTYQITTVFIFLTISFWQFLLFAMYMDIQDNERLNR